MSFILDALKKSETERQNQGKAEFADVPSSADGPRAPRWLWPLGALLAVNGIYTAGNVVQKRGENAKAVQPKKPSVR